MMHSFYDRDWIANQILDLILRKPAFVEGASGVVSGERSE